MHQAMPPVTLSNAFKEAILILKYPASSKIS